MLLFTRPALEDLRARMIYHGVDSEGAAWVRISAQELQILLAGYEAGENLRYQFQRLADWLNTRKECSTVTDIAWLNHLVQSALKGEP